MLYQIYFLSVISRRFVSPMCEKYMFFIFGRQNVKVNESTLSLESLVVSIIKNYFSKIFWSCTTSLPLIMHTRVLF